MQEIDKYSIGVFIGRLQVHELHDGHHYVIQQVVNNHKKTIIFLGVPQFVGTKKNPLDFDTRKKMVENHYPNSVIVALPDNRDNQKWTHELDRRIREIYPHGHVLMYGSRDSFLPYYVNGKFQTKELEPYGTFTGTDVRKFLSEDVKNSTDFRAGVIYHAYNLFPRVIPTVTIAILNDDRTKVLIAKKYDEPKFQFVGGFILPSDKSIKESINRVFNKETGGNAEIKNIFHIDTIQIDDWRFRGEEDKVMTNFYSVEIKNGPIQPTEDIIELKWETIDGDFIDMMINEHKPLVEILLNSLFI